jgi:hypothetical protein
MTEHHFCRLIFAEKVRNESHMDDVLSKSDSVFVSDDFFASTGYKLKRFKDNHQHDSTNQLARKVAYVTLTHTTMEDVLRSTMELPSKSEDEIISPEVSDRDASSHPGYSADVTSRDEDSTTNAEMDGTSSVTATADNDVDTSEIKTMLQETLPMASAAHSISADTTPMEGTSVFMDVVANPMDTDAKAPSTSVAISAESSPSESPSVPSSIEGEVYVNHGLVAWEKNRERWLDRGQAGSSGRKHAKPIPVDEIIDAIFTTPKKLLLNGGVSETFPVSVPLPQLVDILQDLWEAEAM